MNTLHTEHASLALPFADNLTVAVSSNLPCLLMPSTEQCAWEMLHPDTSAYIFQPV